MQVLPKKEKVDLKIGSVLYAEKCTDGCHSLKMITLAKARLQGPIEKYIFGQCNLYNIVLNILISNFR